MNIHEHQAKELLRKYGISVPNGVFAFTVNELLEKVKNLKKQKIIVNATSGISGAGRNLDSRKLFPEGEDNYQAYAVRSHRHYPEILQTLSDDNDDLDVLFVPHLSSMTRGIYSTLYLKHDFEEIEEVVQGYKDFYGKSSFIEITSTIEIIFFKGEGKFSIQKFIVSKTISLGLFLI
mgnify:CR=1 FL=1